MRRHEPAPGRGGRHAVGEGADYSAANAARKGEGKLEELEDLVTSHFFFSMPGEFHLITW